MAGAARRVFHGVPAIERTIVNSLGSIRRVALGVALAGAVLAAAPALAGASPCTYNPNLKQAGVVDASGVSQLRVFVSSGVLTVRDGGGAPTTCAGGGMVATTANTDRVGVFAAAKGASDGVVLDQAGGAFAPGAASEADGRREIEIAITGKSGHLTVFGTPGADVLRVVGDSGLDLGGDGDTDVSFSASDVALVGGAGADLIAGEATLQRINLPLSIGGGAGDDVLVGGAGVDHFAGNAGDDTLHTADGHQELVSGGPDVDHAVRDGGDLLSSVETSAFGSIPAGSGATRPGSVSTAVAAGFAS